MEKTASNILFSTMYLIFVDAIYYSSSIAINSYILYINSHIIIIILGERNVICTTPDIFFIIIRHSLTIVEKKTNILCRTNSTGIHSI